VQDREPQRETNVEEVTSTLATSLKSCRSVVSGYRALLAGSPPGDASQGQEEPIPTQSTKAANG
jgi:hypothetical protein